MLKTTSYVGKYLGGYRITLELASSSTSRIFLGESVSPEKYNVAIKRMYATHIDSAQDQESFLHEARVQKRLDHPYILPILVADIDKGTPYIVSEYASHGSLRDRLQRQAPRLMEQNEVLTIIAQIGQALHYAHQKNIVHGNLKPQNVLFNARGEAQLTDFKLTSLPAQLYDASAAASDSSIYMAPEQIEGTSSKKSDQYALASIAYEMFTGRKPFTTPSANQPGVYYKTKTLIAPTKLNPDLPQHIEQAILKAMAKEPGQRCETIEEFLNALGISPLLTIPNTPVILPNTPDKLRALSVEKIEKDEQADPLANAEALTVPFSAANAGASQFAQMPVASTRSFGGKGSIAPSRSRARLPFIIITSVLLIGVITTAVVFGFSGGHFLPGNGRPTGTTGARPQATQPTAGTQATPAPASTQTGTNKRPATPAGVPTPVTGVNIPPQPTQPLQPTQPIPPTAAPPAPTAIVQPTAPPPPVPTQAPQPAPPAAATLAVAPGNFSAMNCTLPGNGTSLCTANLTLSANAGGGQSWYTYSIGVVASFSPSKGTIAPGQTITITITVNDTCTTAGTFVFVGAKTNVTVGWNC